MVLTGAQVTLFFEDATQMAIPPKTFVKLQVEGIVTVEDLADFKATELENIVDKLRKPTRRISDPKSGAVGGPPAGEAIPIPPFIFSARVN